MNKKEIRTIKRSFATPNEAIESLNKLVRDSVLRGVSGVKITLDPMFFEYVEWIDRAERDG